MKEYFTIGITTFVVLFVCTKDRKINSIATPLIIIFLWPIVWVMLVGDFLFGSNKSDRS